MKNLVFLLFFCLNLGVFAQAGVYVREPNLNGGDKMKWTLSLFDDGCFTYHFYRDLRTELNPEENYYGRGTWKAEKSIIMLTTNKATDLNDAFTMDFTNSKARYTTKSPRDTSNRMVKTSLRFYQSDIFHITGLELFKEQNDEL